LTFFKAFNVLNLANFTFNSNEGANLFYTKTKYLIMNKLILTSTLFICLSCTTNETTVKANGTNNTSLQEDVKYSNSLTVEESDYSIKIEVINQKSAHPSLLISMVLKDGAYFASPLTKEELKGKFYYDFGEYTNLEFFNKVIETPLFIKNTDVTSNILDPAWAVKSNTTYEQQLTLKTKKDFEVLGRVQFTIEPRCTFETIPFGIKYENGEFKLFSPKC